MTVDSAMLLQMLEPAVRPGQLSVRGGVQQSKPAFENRSFDDLLGEAKATMGKGTDDATSAPTQLDPLGVLGGMGQIENAGLREVLAQAGRAASEAGAKPDQAA